MKSPITLKNVRDMATNTDNVSDTLDDVIENVFDLIDVEPDFPTGDGLMVERGQFLETVQEWCRANPESSARLLTLRPWDEESGQDDTYYFAEAVRREIIPVIEKQFDNSILLTQLDSKVFALFVTEEHDSTVKNEFDWASRLSGLKTHLSEAVPLSFHLESAYWPDDASIALTLLDVASPADTDISEIPLSLSNELKADQPFESVIKAKVLAQLDDKLPNVIQDNLPIHRLLN